MPILTTSGLCLYKAGVNAGSASSPHRNVSGSEFVIAMISGAEAVLSSIARYDFVTNYSSLNSPTRDILSDAASNYVAAQLIAHDMSQFTSRVEAESMINLYMKNYERAIEMIKDKKQNDFIGARA